MKQNVSCMIDQNIIQIQQYVSPCGNMVIGSYDNKICMCDWSDGNGRPIVTRRLQKTLQADVAEHPSPVIQDAIRQLDEYFIRKRKNFDIQLTIIGTDFQRSVWEKLLEVPYGSTLSYAELAQQIHKPHAVRAVAAAVGANAMSVIIPCHRIIGSNGSLTGYAGGLPAKKYLIELEKNDIG